LVAYIFIPQVSENMLVMAWISHKSSFEEGNVENRGIKVDELEEEHLEGQIVIKIRLGTMHFFKVWKNIGCSQFCRKYCIFFDIILPQEVSRRANCS
jgi:hypothetical protein